jgi:glucose/mannose transport system permease protein
VTQTKSKVKKAGYRLKDLKNWLPAVLLLSPTVILLAIFVYGFIGITFSISLNEQKGSGAVGTFIGFDNYVALLDDQRFHIDIWNTILFSTVFIGVSLALGLGLAILLDQKFKGEGFFRTVYLFPMAISFIVSGVIWRWLMNPATGSRTTGLNLLFENVGLGFLANEWHLTPTWGMAAIALPAIWQMSGYTMALFLAGLRSIPEEVKEAARMDGASEFAIYWRIILPMISPVALSAIVILGHISLKVFDLIIAVAGKQLFLDVPSIYMWSTTYDAYNFGRGATLAIYILVSVAVFVVPYLILTNRKEKR